MGFSIKLAPGVRIRASSRGIRTSVGPRAARLHVGGGRTGFSSGAGPVNFYTSLSGTRRRSTGRTSAAASQRAMNQAAKAEAAQQLRAALMNILTLHRQDFPESRHPVAAKPPEVATEAVHAKHRKQAKAGISLFKRAERRAAKARADELAAAEIQRLEQKRSKVRSREQAELDRWWTALSNNDETVVLEVLAAAFEDNEAPAAPVGVNGSELTAVVLVPTIDSTPEKKPTTTQAGNLSLKKLTKSERCGLHTALVASHVLLTVREALAVAPGLSSVRVVALQQSHVDAFGAPRIDVLLAARFERSRLASVRWDEAEASAIVHDAGTEVVSNVKRTTRELQPLNLEAEPAIRDLLDHIEVGDLLDRPR